MIPFVILWLTCGLVAWFFAITIYWCGFELIDLIMLPLSMLMGLVSIIMLLNSLQRYIQEIEKI